MGRDELNEPLTADEQLPDNELRVLEPDVQSTISSADIVPVLHPTGHFIGHGVSFATEKALRRLEKSSVPTGTPAVQSGWATWAGALPANGGREVAIIVPPGCDLNRPLEVITYFRGLNGNTADSLSGDDSIHEQLARLSVGPPRRNAVFVIPAMNPGAHPEPANRRWMAPPESLQELQDQALSRIQSQWCDDRPRPLGDVFTVIAHSFGGQAVANAVDGGTLRASRIILLDATYVDRARRIAAYVTLNPSVRIDVLFRPDSDTEMHARADMTGMPQVHFFVTRDEHSAIPSHHLARNFFDEPEDTP